MLTRDNTNDAKVVDNVLRRNEYRLPAAFHPEDVVVDIGAHIGSFARACLVRGVRQVHCYEPHPDNHRLLLQNCARYAYKRMMPYDRAVVAGGSTRVTLRVAKGNTGGHSVIYGDDTNALEVPAVSISEVIERARKAAPNGRVRLLKLDCEGAEHSLIDRLSAYPEEVATIDEITGELHDLGEEHSREVVNPISREETLQRLNALGYTVETWNEMSDGLVLFRAYRSETVTERPPAPAIPIEDTDKGADSEGATEREGADTDRTNTDAPEAGVPLGDAGTPEESGSTESPRRDRSGSRGRSRDTGDSAEV